MPIIHREPNAAPIDRLYAFMSIDDQGRHGILASILPGLGSTPLVTGSAKAVESMKPIARQIARETGLKVGLFAFDRVKMVWSPE